MIGITVRVDMGLVGVLLGFLCCHFMVVSSDDIVVACGGFVKSDVEINYSLIEVRRGETSGLATLLACRATVPLDQLLDNLSSSVPHQY